MRRGGSGGQTPFARAYLPWIAAWQDAGLGGTPTRILLLLISRMEFGTDGIARAWYPREEMAKVLGISESAVSNGVQTLLAKRFIVIEQAGRKGAATVYGIMPDCPVTAKAPKVPYSALPNDAKGATNRPPKVPHSAVPLRSKEIGRGHEAAPPKRGQGCDVDARGALDAPAQRVRSGAEFLAEYLGEGVEDGG